MNPLTETSADTGGSPDIAAVLFDMDGTLIDSEHLWLRAEVATVASIGGQWTEEDQHLCLGGPLERVAEHAGLRRRARHAREEPRAAARAARVAGAASTISDLAPFFRPPDLSPLEDFAGASSGSAAGRPYWLFSGRP